MKLKLLLFYFLIIFTKATAQESRKFLYAEIKDKIGPIVNAHIINKNTNQGTFSNESGEFRILAKPNDSLKISSIGYKTKTYKVKITHFGIQQNNIFIEKINYELDEVKIRNHDLLGYLSSDSKKIKTEKTIDAKSLKLPYAGSRILTPAERKLYTALGGGNLLSIDHIINRISGRIKKLRKLKAIEKEEKRITFIHTNYKNYIKHHLKLKSEDIFRFVHYCESDSDFSTINYREKIAMLKFLEQKAIEFKELNPKTYQ